MDFRSMLVSQKANCITDKTYKLHFPFRLPVLLLLITIAYVNQRLPKPLPSREKLVLLLLITIAYVNQRLPKPLPSREKLILSLKSV